MFVGGLRNSCIFWLSDSLSPPYPPRRPPPPGQPPGRLPPYPPESSESRIRLRGSSLSSRFSTQAPRMVCRGGGRGGGSGALAAGTFPGGGAPTGPAGDCAATTPQHASASNPPKLVSKIVRVTFMGSPELRHLCNCTSDPTEKWFPSRRYLRQKEATVPAPSPVAEARGRPIRGIARRARGSDARCGQ